MADTDSGTGSNVAHAGFAQPRPLVLVFLSNTNELQRFVLSGAFARLADHYRLEYVCTAADSQRIMEASNGLIHRGNSRVLDIPEQRAKMWGRLFEASCYQYAGVSRSFALRVGSPRDYFEVRLLRASWRLARRFGAPLLARLAFLRSRWSDRSPKREETITKFLDSDAFLQIFSQAGAKTREADEILASLTPYPPLTELLEAADPVFCVLPTSLLDAYCGDLVLAAEAANYVVLALQSGWDNLSSKGILHRPPKFMGVWGDQSADHARTIQRVPKAAIEVLGAPHYELLRSIPAQARSEFRDRLGVRPDETLILFGGSFRQFDETSVLRRLDHAIAGGRLGKTKILYRPHPWRADRSDEGNFFDRKWRHVIFDPDMRERYVRSKSERGFLKKAPMYDMEYLATLLSSVDCVMSPMSTLLIEAVIMERPTMAIAFGDGKHQYHPDLSAKMTHFEGLAKSRALIWCDNAAALEEKARALTARCGRPIDQEARAKLLRRIVRLDPSQNYAERLRDYCVRVVEPAGRMAAQKRGAARRKHMSQSYGALIILKRYCTIDDERVDIPGYWMHGWIPAYHNQHPGLIALHKKKGQGPDHDYARQIEEEKASVMQWVSRGDQEAYLRAHGYERVRAVSIPFAYLPPVHVKRKAGSLLVMPPHAHHTHGPDDPVAEEYAALIASAAGDFSEVCICLNADDYARNQWRTSFEKRGVKVIVGADQNEGDTLLRLKGMFSHFEYMTTNGFGSHIAYAAAAGAKVSVYGPFAEFPMARIRKSHAIKIYPEAAELSHFLCTEAPLKEAFPFLFTDPSKAPDSTAWGLAEVGADKMLAPEQAAATFGWDAILGEERENTRNVA